MSQSEGNGNGGSLGVLHGRFPALRSRDFRLLWTGQGISAAGSQMQFWAINWHIYTLTHSTIALGLIGLFRIVPIIIFSMLGGTAADAWDRRRVLLVTQTCLALVAATLGYLTYKNEVTATSIYLLTAAGAAALAFDNPSRQSLIPNLVPREDFPNAASLNSIAMQVATIVGPLLAGLLLAHNGLAATYWINAVSFVAVLIALVLMSPRASGAAHTGRSDVSVAALMEGLQFVWSTPILVAMLTLDFFATFFSSANALLPVFARDILHVSPAAAGAARAPSGGLSGLLRYVVDLVSKPEYRYGLLASAQAIGSLVAGAIMAWIPTVRRQGPVVLWAVLFYGLATVVFGASRWFPLSFVALAVVGASDTVSTILRQTIRQLLTPDRLRGRMTAVNMVFFMGGPQLGELEAGMAARWLGSQWSVIVGGVGCIIALAGVVVKAPVLRHYHSGSPEEGPGERRA